MQKGRRQPSSRMNSDSATGGLGAEPRSVADPRETPMPRAERVCRDTHGGGSHSLGLPSTPNGLGLLLTLLGTWLKSKARESSRGCSDFGPVAQSPHRDRVGLPMWVVRPARVRVCVSAPAQRCSARAD
jgi:hypothetical protein